MRVRQRPAAAAGLAAVAGAGQHGRAAAADTSAVPECEAARRQRLRCRPTAALERVDVILDSRLGLGHAAGIRNLTSHGKEALTERLTRILTLPGSGCLRRKTGSFRPRLLRQALISPSFWRCYRLGLWARRHRGFGSPRTPLAAAISHTTRHRGRQARGTRTTQRGVPLRLMLLFYRVLPTILPTFTDFYRPIIS